jgi:5-(carboxyamino)imidazole ribonucleotide synthase
MVAVGVIGGGQLARMTAQVAPSLGIEVGILPTSMDDPAIKFASYIAENLTDLVHRSDVITFENEFCDLALLNNWAEQGVRFYPRLDSLAILVDKYRQRSFLTEFNLPTPQYVLITDRIDPICQELTFPLVMKSCRQGYDGKGTTIISNLDHLKTAWDHTPAILETFIDFEQELAIMITRSVTGEISLFPVVETEQIDRVCRRVIAPARISGDVKSTIENIATQIVNQLDYIGILGIEFFLTKDSQILVNEMAPRPHNSGHYTIEGCVTSQFSQLLRSILGMPLGATNMISPVAIMVNLLGLAISEYDYQQRLLRLQQLSQIHLHWYDKQPRPGRKLGHVTVLGDSYDSALQIAKTIEEIWYS